MPVVSLVGKLRLNKPFVGGDGRLVNIEFTYFDMTDFDTFPSHSSCSHAVAWLTPLAGRVYIPSAWYVSEVFGSKLLTFVEGVRGRRYYGTTAQKYRTCILYVLLLRTDPFEERRAISVNAWHQDINYNDAHWLSPVLQVDKFSVHITLSSDRRGGQPEGWGVWSKPKYDS